MSRLLAFLLLVWLCLHVQDAQAQVSTGDQGDAYARCMSALAAVNRTHTPGTGYFGDPGSCPHDIYQGTYGRYTCKITRYNDNGTVQNPAANCIPGAYMWIYPLTSNCSAKAPLLNVSYQGTLASCSGGCEYAASVGQAGDSVTVVGSGAAAITRVARMTPTGQTCTVGAEFQQVQPQTTDVCKQQGNLAQCVTADGRTCSVASSGKKFCWQPSEAGIKVSGNEAATKSPEGSAIKQPPKAPNNGGEWQQGGTGQVSVTQGGTTNNYNTTNWNSSYGNQGSGANGGGADGEGNGGSGDGSGEGEGDDGWGEPGQGVGDLYEGTDKTIAGLMGNFFNQAKNAPVMQGVTNFMGVTSSGGQCPVFTVPATQFWDSMTFDGHCSGTWLQLLMACGWVALALSAYFAVRIAVT